MISYVNHPGNVLFKIGKNTDILFYHPKILICITKNHFIFYRSLHDHSRFHNMPAGAIEKGTLCAIIFVILYINIK